MTENPIWIAGGLAAGLVSIFGMMSILPKIENGLEVKTQTMINKSGLKDQVKLIVSGQDIRIAPLNEGAIEAKDLAALQTRLKSDLSPLSPSLAGWQALSKGYWVKGPISQIKIMKGSVGGSSNQSGSTEMSASSIAQPVISETSISKETDKPGSTETVSAPKAKDMINCQNQLAAWLKTYPLTYAPAGYQLDRAARGRVKDLKDQFLACGQNMKLQIVGHTDSIGEDKTNQLVSLARAEALRNALIVEGLSPDQVSFEGRGEQSPIASNATKSGRAQNRRTEIIISSLSGANP